MMNVKPYWVLVAGFVVLLIFVMVIRSPMHRRLGPGGTERQWLGPGGTERQRLGPGGTEQHHLLGSFFEAFTSSAETSRFTMFGVDWCPHCVKAKPEFESLGPTTTIGGHPVQCRYVNPESDKQQAQGFEIEGYPTFYLEKGAKKIKYSGPRNRAGFEEFLAKHA